MSGVSAGGICWFEGFTTDSFGPELRAVRDGFGVLSGSFIPHYHGEAQRRPLFHRLVADGTLPGGLRRRRRGGARLPRDGACRGRVRDGRGGGVSSRGRERRRGRDGALASAAGRLRRRALGGLPAARRSHVAIGRTASGASTALAAGPGAVDGLGPAGWHEAGREVGERGEDEQPLPGEPMRDDEVGRLDRVVGSGLRRPLDVDPVAAEDEQVEVELARAPALALLPAERPLDALERDQQRERAGRPGPGRSGRRGRRRRCGTRAGRRRRPARSRTGATRHGAGRPAAPRARGRRPRSSRPHRRGSRRARCTPGWSWPVSGLRSLDSASWEPSASSSSTPSPAPSAGPLAAWVAAERRILAERHRAAFAAAGATTSGSWPASRTAGRSDRCCASSWLPSRTAGIVVLGSGSIPLATAADRRALVAAAAGRSARRAHEQPLLVGRRRDRLRGGPRGPARPAVRQRPAALARGARRRAGPASWPRGGFASTSTTHSTSCCCGGRDRRWRCACRPDVDASRVTAALAAVAAVARDPAAELLVAGPNLECVAGLARTRTTAARVRALVEERGLRASDPAAASAAPARRRPPRPCWARRSTAAARSRSARSSARLGDAALVDTRVLLAHRLGADERRLARRRGPLRVGPAAARADRRSVAPGADASRRRGPDPDRPRRPHARRARPPPGARARPMDGLRRVPATDIDAVAGDPALEALIRDEIAAGGPMTFARFMELALYHPERGYYRAAAARPGRDGRLPDRARGPPDLRPRDRPPRRRRLVGARPPGRFTIREHGAGTGALAAALIDGLRTEAPELASASATGPSRSSRGASTRSRSRLEATPRGRRRRADHRPRDRERGPRRAADPPGRRDGRRHRRGLRRRRGRPARRRRGATPRRRRSPPGSTPRASRSPTASGPRSASRVDAWVAAAAAGLERGLLLLVDYGHPAADLYDRAPPPGRHARGVPRPPGPRRPVPRDRPPGPHRPRRRHRRRASGARRRPGPPRRRRPRARSWPGSARATCSSACRPARTRSSRPTSRPAPRSSG